MPTVFRWNGYRFFFFSNEGVPREPMHIHVRNGEKLAKFWIEPDIRLAANYGMTSAEVRQLIGVIEKNAEKLRRAWNEHFEL
jgi:hypothetical protein